MVLFNLFFVCFEFQYLENEINIKIYFTSCLKITSYCWKEQCLLIASDCSIDMYRVFVARNENPRCCELTPLCSYSFFSRFSSINWKQMCNGFVIQSKLNSFFSFPPWIYYKNWLGRRKICELNCNLRCAFNCFWVIWFVHVFD
jgi:hypothetical protein